MKVKKAVILAAGMGTRMLPSSKVIPKEILPVVDTPAIQVVVEEAVASGIEEIILVISPGKTTVVDHFKLQLGARAPSRRTRQARISSNSSGGATIRRESRSPNSGIRSASAMRCCKRARRSAMNRSP